ncbi:MAG: sensor histidine kinase, partial [Gemmatimonadota bacterium]
AADQMPRVRTDHRALALVLGNLVKNGIRYSDPEKAERWVRVDARRTAPDDEQGMVLIRVEDDGIGIPEEARPRIFERFYRAATDVPGTGLGLGLVREEVERWGGRVWFESEEGVGTSFRFTIQAAE